MSKMDEDEDEYGDIADEDLFEFEAQSQGSQTLPPLPRPNKHLLDDDDISEPEAPKRRHKSRASTTDHEDGGSGKEDENAKKKKAKYRIIDSVQPVPSAKVIGATQAEQLPDSSPYRIRGPIYMKPRPEARAPTPPPRQQRPSMFQQIRQQEKVMSVPAQRPAPLSVIHQPRRQTPPRRDVEDEYGLDDLPSDAFSSLEKPAERESILIGSSPLQPSQLPRQRLVAPQQGLRQMNLFGGRAPEEPAPTQSQARASHPKPKKVYNFIKDLPPEEPTHHPLDEEALKTWIYPTNLGAIRDYQYNIVHNGLFNNLLVALPTGLGKTFIAATIMLNFYRWTRNAQIVFMAPTKPLVSQQVDACFNIVGIPRSQTTMLTGDQNTNFRAEEWEDKRVFFMTPQTLHNDLSSGIADPKKICLLVVDEAHRATGNYSYVKVVTFLRRFNKSFRILALTATPGSSVEAVQDVIDNLEISKVEIRTEESLDIQKYVHRRDIDQITMEPSDEIMIIKGLFAKALQPLVNQLCGQNAYYNKDPMALTPFGLLHARAQWHKSEAGRKAPQGLKGMVMALFTILASLAHSIKLLNFHGIGPFYSVINDFRREAEEAKAVGKYRRQVVDNQDFKKMMDMIQAWISKDDFIGHPKLTYLCDTILNHFLDAGEGRLGEDAPPSSTRVIVFSEFRDSAEEIVRVLNRHGPMIRATVFVGQQDSKRSEGMNQAKQQEVISQFKSGKFNVIVATSIGEEGLDIGQVDLIVCYDASGSPIRMLQRMGRTGRKRAGHIVLLLMKGKEEESFAKARDNYEQMQKMISSGERFAFRHDLSVRILPRTVKPVVDKKVIEIPIENTQNPGLPEPKRRATKARKKKEKVFHMPDGVQTGFTKASKLGADGSALTQFGIIIKKTKVEIPLEPIPSMESVFLTPTEERELVRRFQDIDGDEVQEVELPNMTAQTVAQRSLRPHGNIAHGEKTIKCVKLFKTLSRMQKKEDQLRLPYGDIEPSLDYLEPFLPDDDPQPQSKARARKSPAEPKYKKVPAPRKPRVSKAKAPKKNQSRAAQFLASADLDESEGDENSGPPSSEGEGDDLMHSEEISQDEDDGGSSMRDFLATSSQQGPTQSGLVRSSASPEVNGDDSEDEDDAEATPRPTEKNVEKNFVEVDSEIDEDSGAELPSFSASKPGVAVGESLDSDDIVAPVPARGRKDRRRVVEDSDDDE